MKATNLLWLISHTHWLSPQLRAISSKAKSNAYDPRAAMKYLGPASHNQLMVSMHQLNCAIDLFLDKKDFYCSATLAGAAEEILGKLSNNNGQSNSLIDCALRLEAYLTDNEIDALSDERRKKPSDILNGVLNKYKNWLKHYSEDEFHLFIDAEEAASELIHRAVCNLARLALDESEQIKKFRTYQQNKYS